MSRKSKDSLLSRRRRPCRPRVEQLEPRLMLAAHWQNSANPLDIDDNGAAAPKDLLVLMNDLGRHGSRAVPELAHPTQQPPPFLDVNGDNLVSSLDALLLINQWNRVQPHSSQTVTPSAQTSNVSALSTSSIDRSELLNVDAQTDVLFSGMFTNRRSGQSTTNVRMTNTSTMAIPTPLILVIESISDPTVTVANADGSTTPDGKPLFDLSGQVPGDQLDPGETTSNRPLVFHNPNLRPFTVQASVYHHLATPAVPEVSLELPTDSQGRTFIGAPDGVTLTVRAAGTDPVTVELGQQAAAVGSRGRVFFGASGTETTATVTTSGGTDNVAEIPVRGDATKPSAFQSDLELLALAGGSQETSKDVTVLKIEIDLHTSELVNDIPVIRTITTIPAVPDLAIDLQFFRAQLVEQGYLPPLVPSELSVNVIPLSGSSLTTGANGTVQFQLQQGPAGQGVVVGTAQIIDPTTLLIVSGTSLIFVAEAATETRCDICCDVCSVPDPRDSGSSGSSSNSVRLFSGGKALNETDLVIPGRGVDFDFSRSFRSQASHLRAVDTGDFAVDWGFSYSDDRLIQDVNNVIAVNPRVRSDTFLATGTPGVFRSPMEYYDQLTINAAGDYQIRTPRGMTKTYEDFDHGDIPGRLVSMQDSDGNRMTFHYAQIDPDTAVSGDEKHVLAFVIDTLGREIRYQYYADSSQIVDGRIVTIPHPADNTTAWGRLAQVVDFKGDMDFDDTAESEDFAGQVNNRTLHFDYDAEANLIAVTSPDVAGTPHGNDFPDGKTVRYDYVREADIPASITGLDRQRLLHNLVSIQAPNETTLDPGTPHSVLVYGDNPNAPASFDRVLTYTIGGTNLSDVPAGGTIQYSYEFVAPSAINTNDPYMRTTVSDRRGNVTQYTFSPFDTLLEKRELTSGFRADEPEAFVTRYRYNIDKKLVRETLPAGNVVQYVYDQGKPNRFQQGNLIRTIQTADSARGGDQTVIRRETVYEPIYQQAAFITDPRGLDPSFIPPVPDPSGRSQRERYTTRYFYDYQEAAPALVLPLLAAQLGVSQAQVQARLDAAGVQLGLGDLNGDGEVSPRISGRLIRVVQPAVVLLPESNQAAIEGDQLQDIVTRYRYNDFGQMTSLVDPEGNVHVYEYFPEDDPDGDGVLTPAPADGRSLDPSTGGYLAEQVRDTVADPLRNNRTNPAPVNISARYTYDDVGNMTSVIDGRGIRTDYFVNELNQVVQTTHAAAVPPSGPGTPEEPLPLVAFGYLSRTFYDFNDNVVLTQTEDRGNTSSVDGNPPTADLPLVPGADNPDPLAGTAFVDTVYKYDILDNVIETLAEVINPSAGTAQLPDGEFLRTRYRYDANENRVLTILPEGNAAGSIHDERDLIFQQIGGVSTRPSAGRYASNDPTSFNRPGGLYTAESITTYNYDQNRNLIEVVDAEDHGGASSSIAGVGDATRFTYDGFDRRRTITDAMGNTTAYAYDPASNVIRIIGNGHPDNDQAGSSGDKTLQVTEFVHDELGRTIATHQVLFQTPDVPLVRTPELSSHPDMSALAPYLADADGNDAAVPGATGIIVIGRITTLTEYDRRSRATFQIRDNLVSSRSDYDGAGRLVRTTDSALSTGFVGGGFDPDALLGNTVEMAYDSNSNLIERLETDVTTIANVDPQKFRTTWLYDSLNRVQSVVDAVGQTTDYRYDSRDNLVATADAVGPVTGRTISRRGLGSDASVIVNDFGNVTRYRYDGQSRLVETEQILTDSGRGDGTQIGATLEGELVTPPPADANQSGDGLVSTYYAYDANSQLLALRDDNGNTTGYIYDNQNRLLVERKGLIITGTSFNLTGGDSAAFNVALRGASTSPVNTEPDGTDINYVYDRDSNLIETVDEAGNEIICAYDANNRRVSCTITLAAGFIGTTAQAWTYDGLGRQRSSFDNNGAGSGDDVTSTSAYDSLSRLVEESQQVGAGAPVYTVSNSYDLARASGGVAVASPTAVTYPDGRVVESQYDTLDRLLSKRDAGASDAIAVYEYIGKWRVATLTYQNNTRLNHIGQVGGENADVGFDDNRRIIDHRWESFTPGTTALGDGTLLVGFGHTYDRANNKQIEEKQHAADLSEVYIYDSIYRLANPGVNNYRGIDDAFRRGTLNADKTDVETLTAFSGILQTHDFALDGVHNWNSNSHQVDGNSETEDRTHSDFNEIVDVTGTPYGGVPTRTDEHDANGNLTNDGRLKYEWDAKNRLSRVSRVADSEVVAEYVYDAHNRRMRKVVSNSGLDGTQANGTTEYVYSGWQVLEERSGSGDLRLQYIYGNYIDEPWVRDDRSGGQTITDLNDGSGLDRLFYHQNTQYSVHALTNETGTVVEGYFYDPYGRQIVVIPGTNGTVDWSSASDDILAINGDSPVGNEYMYTGRQWNPEIKNYYVRERYYDALRGTMLSRNALGYAAEGMNLYIVWMSLRFWVDPYGLPSDPPPGGEAGGEGGDENQWPVPTLATDFVVNPVRMGDRIPGYQVGIEFAFPPAGRPKGVKHWAQVNVIHRIKIMEDCEVKYETQFILDVVRIKGNRPIIDKLGLQDVPKDVCGLFELVIKTRGWLPRESKQKPAFGKDVSAEKATNILGLLINPATYIYGYYYWNKEKCCHCYGLFREGEKLLMPGIGVLE